ncbi:MAG TPA: putative sugar nucleotidyl transferase [Flavisolibacter sp.]|nr:putative sugar nucleotidyl transferase [Flavisolibacter sp.]
MKKIVFTEEYCSPENLFPFVLTRQVQDIRLGIFSIREKWEKHLQMPSFNKYEDDYKDLGNSIQIDDQINNDIIYLIHGNVLPTKKLVKQIKRLKHGEFISVPGKESIAYCITKKEVVAEHKIKVRKALELDEELQEVIYSWDISRKNNWAIAEDFELVKKTAKHQRISSTNKVTNAAQVLIEKGAKVEHCYLNAEEGPIYIGKNATIMEGSMLRGPIAICEGAVVKMGSKIYGATTIGPNCIVGGEIKNSVFFGNSNKAHDGYIGDSVIGEWCNLGAGTSNSNIKNNASGVIVWTPNGPVNVGLKCGVLMGDYSRTSINTAINTGTVVGVSANVFGPGGLTPKYIPSFSWGSDGLERYQLEKAFDDINSWKVLKGNSITETEKQVLYHIYNHYP